MERLTPEFKKAFNEVLDECNKIRDSRGNFHLTRELDFALIPLVDKIKKAFDVYQQKELV